MAPLISVIIPTKNRCSELQRAIYSVLLQTLNDIELLIVDDYSEENIQFIVNEFKDPRVYYYKNTSAVSNANVCRNIGLTNAQGKYIAMLDSDDEWLPDHLEKKLAWLELNKADGVFGSYLVDNGEQKISRISRPLYHNEQMVNYILSDGTAQTSTHFYKAECAKAVKWDETLVRHQDYDYTIRFYEQYKFIPAFDLSCIVYWKKGVSRSVHYQSQISFIQKYKSNINKKVYCKYHRDVYVTMVLRNDIAANIKNYFRKESIRYIDQISLTDYITTFGQQRSKMYKLYLRLEFAFKILIK